MPRHFSEMRINAMIEDREEWWSLKKLCRLRRTRILRLAGKHRRKQAGKVCFTFYNTAGGSAKQEGGGDMAWLLKALAAENPPERSRYHIIVGVILSLLIKFKQTDSDYASGTSRRKGCPALPGNRKAPPNRHVFIGISFGKRILDGTASLRAPKLSLATVSGGDHG